MKENKIKLEQREKQDTTNNRSMNQGDLQKELEKNIKDLYLMVLKGTMKKFIYANFVKDIKSQKKQNSKRQFLFSSKEETNYQEITSRLTNEQINKSWEYADQYVKDFFWEKYKNTLIDAKKMSGITKYFEKTKDEFIKKQTKSYVEIFKSKIFRRRLEKKQVVLKKLIKEAENKVTQEFTHSFDAIQNMRIFDGRSFQENKPLSSLLGLGYKKRNKRLSKEILESNPSIELGQLKAQSDEKVLITQAPSIIEEKVLADSKVPPLPVQEVAQEGKIPPAPPLPVREVAQEGEIPPAPPLPVQGVAQEGKIPPAPRLPVQGVAQEGKIPPPPPMMPAIEALPDRGESLKPLKANGQLGMMLADQLKNMQSNLKQTAIEPKSVEQLSPMDALISQLKTGQVKLKTVVADAKTVNNGKAKEIDWRKGLKKTSNSSKIYQKDDSIVPDQKKEIEQLKETSTRINQVKSLHKHRESATFEQRLTDKSETQKNHKIER